MVAFNIKYLEQDMERIKPINGNWIDLRAIEVEVINGEDKTDIKDCYGDWKFVTYKKGDIVKVNFGVAIDMTDLETGEEYISNLFPRSSLFKNFHLLLTNGVGCIDHSYKGNEDWYRGMFIALQDGVIEKGDRLCQVEFRKPQDVVQFVEVQDLGNASRGGYGTSGKQ